MNASKRARSVLSDSLNGLEVHFVAISTVPFG
jgi:hypothetical protein